MSAPTVCRKPGSVKQAHGFFNFIYFVILVRIHNSSSLNFKLLFLSCFSSLFLERIRKLAGLNLHYNFGFSDS